MEKRNSKGLYNCRRRKLSGNIGPALMQPSQEVRDFPGFAQIATRETEKSIFCEEAVPDGVSDRAVQLLMRKDSGRLKE